MSNPDKKIWWHYCTTLLYLFLFISILIFFDIAMRIARLFSYKAFRYIELLMCKTIHENIRLFTGASIKINSEILPSNIPLIVISNHQSMYDVSLLDQIFYKHEPRFISKKELGSFVPAVSFISRNNKTVLIDRKDRAQSLKAMQQGALQAADEKAALCIFPEGTRAKDGNMKPFKTAGLQILMKNMPNALLVPVTIDGTWQLLRYSFLPVPWGCSITITVGKPITINAEDPALQIQQIESLIHSQLKS